jgi:hypothetical protein
MSFDINELMVSRKLIVTDVTLIIASTGTRTPIKHILDSYVDNSKKYDNTIKNIFLLNDIKTNSSDTIEIKYMNILSGNKIANIECGKFIENHISDAYSLI